MGRKNHGKFFQDMHQQAYEKLKSMLAIGDSKYADKQYDKEHGTHITAGKIYSYDTYHTYWRHIKYFIGWMKETHPDITTLKKAERYVPEWLECRADQGLSAWTVSVETAALCKLYRISPDDPDRFQPPKRRTEDIKRSRGPKEMDAKFSEKKNQALVDFCRAVGPRRGVLEKMRGSDYYSRDRVEQTLEKAKKSGDVAMERICRDALMQFPDKKDFILHYNDKGGKDRISPIVGPHTDEVVARMKSTKPDARVWLSVPVRCDVHGYRAEYATALYREYARPVEQLDFKKKVVCADGKLRSEIYICRGENKKILDRVAVHKVSVALGHNREDTAIVDYIRDH